MSDSGKGIFPDFGKLVPGFDFLQNLTRQASASAGSGMPQMPKLGSWVAPTLSVEEIDKRIEELKAVQFWLDQNATALKATIQALEVQKMTLSALQGMNVNMAEMAKAFQVPDASGLASGMNAASTMASNMASTMASGMASMSGASMAGKTGGKTAGSTADKPHHQFEGLEVPETSFTRREHERQAQQGPKEAQPASQQNGHDHQAGGTAQEPAAEAAKAAAGMAAVIDPLQWWGALTQQFQTIANSAMQEAQRHPFEASQAMASDAVRSASKAANELASSAIQTLTQSARKSASKTASKTSSGRAAQSKATGNSARKSAGKATSKSQGRAEGKAEAKPRASQTKAASARGAAKPRKASPRAR